MSDAQHITTNTDGSVCISFDTTIYSVDALKKAAYKFTNRASFHFSLSESTVQVHLSFLAEASDDVKQAVIREYCNEVLDQDLRESISRETEATRNLILAQAFSKTSLLE